MTDSTSSEIEPRRTDLGSPCSPAWDAAWVGVVNAAEQELGRRICGARTMAGTPCTLEPNHENGRCRFHGGFDLTGAPKGNRNAVLHGLYSRRLQVCGSHCPQWTTCPLSGEDVERLARTHQRQRVSKTMIRYHGTPEDPCDIVIPMSEMGKVSFHGPDYYSGGPSRQGRGPEGEAREGEAREGEAPSEPAHAPGRGSDGASPSPPGPGSPEALPGSSGDGPSLSSDASLASLPPTPDASARPEALRKLGKTPVLMTCPYEQAEYNAVFNDALARAEQKPVPDPLDVHQAHTLALMQVMMSRAAAALRAARLVEAIHATGKNYRMESPRVSPYLDAFTRMAREYRAFRKLLDPAPRAARDAAESSPVDALARNAARTEHDTDLAPEAQQAMHVPSDPLADHARRCVQRAARHAALSQDLGLMLQLTEAYAASPEVAAECEAPILRAYRPKRQVLQREDIGASVGRLRAAFEGGRDPPLE